MTQFPYSAPLGHVSFTMYQWSPTCQEPRLLLSTIQSLRSGKCALQLPSSNSICSSVELNLHLLIVESSPTSRDTLLPRIDFYNFYAPFPLGPVFNLPLSFAILHRCSASPFSESASRQRSLPADIINPNFEPTTI